MAVYTPQVVRQVRIFYIVAVLVWLLLVYLLGLFSHGWGGILIAIIPVVVAVIAFIQCPYLESAREEDIMRANFLSLGLIVAISLFAILEKSYLGERRTFAAVVLLAVVASLISLMYVWVGPKYLSLTRHFKSYMQTISVTLLIYAVYLYFIYSEKSGLS